MSTAVAPRGTETALDVVSPQRIENELLGQIGIFTRNLGKPHLNGELSLASQPQAIACPRMSLKDLNERFSALVEIPPVHLEEAWAHEPMPDGWLLIDQQARWPAHKGDPILLPEGAQMPTLTQMIWAMMLHKKYLTWRDQRMATITVTSKGAKLYATWKMLRMNKYVITVVDQYKAVERSGMGAIPCWQLTQA